MSNILKGIINEVSPHNYDSDWDYQDAVARSGKSRSSYRSQEDDTSDADIEYSKKMYQLSQKQKRDDDHDRLATGTNEGVRDLGYDAQSLIMKLRRDVEEKRLQPTRQAILAAARELAGDMNFAPELLVQQVLDKGVAEGILANLSYGAGRGLGKMVAGYRPRQPAPPPTTAQIGLPKLNLDKTLPVPPGPAEQPIDPFKAAPTSPTLTPSQIRQQKQAAATTRARSELGQMSESQEDNPWGDQGNFAGDKPVNVGNVSMKNIQTGDTVKYLGQPSKVVAMSKDRKHSRITITKGIGTVTQDVLTSDLQQLGRGIEEAKSSLQMGDVTDKIKAAVNAATQLNGKVVKTAGGYFKVTTLDDPRPAINANPEYYNNLKKYQDQLKVINAEIHDIEMQFYDNRREVFNDLDELFPNSPKPLLRGSPASIWLTNALANLSHTYYETNKFKTLANQKKTLEDQLKVLRDTENKFQEKPIEEDNTQTRMRMDDYHNLADTIQDKIRQAIQMGNKELIQKLNKDRDDLDARVKQYGLMPESQLDEISNEKLSQYKTAAAADAGKADKEGDYKRGDKRFSGIVKATKKQFANDTKKSGISQGINEFSPGATGPKGPKDYGQPNSSRYIGGNKFVVGTTNNYVLTATIDKWGLEWDEDDEIWFLDSPGAAHIADASEGEIELPPPREQRNQIHDLVTDYLNARNSADLQKVALYYGHSNDGEMATNESSEAPKFNSKQEVINHFVKNGKSAAAGAAAWERGYRGSSNKPIELKKPQRSYHDDLDDKRYASIDENLGDQLKSNSLDALVQAKLAIEKQREAELEAWKQDFQKNTVQKAQQGLHRELQPTPVAQPGEKHSALKARLAQLNNAIQKQELLDKLVDRLDRKGLLTPAMQNDTDTSMHVKYGAKDNYQSLNKKLDNAISMLQDRLYIRKKSGLKEADMGRRGFLGNMGKAAGAGALAAAGLGGASNAQAFKGTLPAPRISEDEAEAQIKELRSKAYKELASMMWNVWPKILDTTFGANTPQDKPATPDEIGKMLGYRLAEYADDYRQKVRAIKIAAGVRDPQSLNKTTASIYVNEQEMDEGWSQKYKSSINCSHPKGFSQKAHCAGKKKHNESIDNVMEMTCPDCGMCETHVDHTKLDEACWKGYHKEGNKKMFGKTYPNCVKNTNEEQLDEKCWDTHKQVGMKNKGGKQVPNCVPKESVEEQHSHSESCPHCGGEMVSEELMNEKKDACYYKVKSRYKVWPSAYASGALVKCRNKGASNWGNGGKKNESSILEGIEQADESLHDWFNKEKWVRMDTKGKIKGPCAREPGEGKPKCLPQSKAHSLGKKGRASAAQRKRREDPNPDRSGKAINVDTKKKD